MYQTFTWLIRLVGIIVFGASLIAYLNVQKKPSLLFSEPSTYDLRYKALDKKRANAEFAANRDHKDYEKFGRIGFVIIHSIVLLNQPIIRNKRICIFSEKMQIYPNGIMLSRITKTKDQKAKTLILKENFFL
tara:strand:+ start:1029 stop:1424 length:396 start_codon:yes stop_codon:yes gene_type:complete